MSSAPHTRSYDPNIVIQAAKDKWAANDLDGGQTLFQSALLNWVDDARENASGLHPEAIKEAIATLWIAYAHFLRDAQQFKSATEAYERAISCPIAGTVGRIWLDYARFLEERDKLKSAQQVYIRALRDQGVTDEQDVNLLWGEFLEMMRQKNPDLTLEQLKQAIRDEATPDAPASSSSDRVPIEETTSTQNSASPSRTHVVTPSEIQSEQVEFSSMLQNAPQDPAFTAAWMVRDGDTPPQPPATALFGPTPPKLSDPTGKDLLGEALALQLVTRLLEASGGVVLQVCQSLWMWTALKEQENTIALKTLDEKLVKESKELQAKLEERLSVAGAAEAAVRAMNQSEEASFQSHCNEERQKILSKYAWDMRQVLWGQQLILGRLAVPGFAGGTVEDSTVELQSRIAKYLHSAFFLRKRIGEKAHQQMLTSQKTRLEEWKRDHPEATVVSGGYAQQPAGMPSTPFAGGMQPQQQQPLYGGPPAPYGSYPPPPQPPQYGQPNPYYNQ